MADIGNGVTINNVTTMPTVFHQSYRNDVNGVTITVAIVDVSPSVPTRPDEDRPLHVLVKEGLVRNNSHLALPASRHAVEESSLCQGSGSVHGPSIVLGKFVQFLFLLV